MSLSRLNLNAQLKGQAILSLHYHSRLFRGHRLSSMRNTTPRCSRQSRHCPKIAPRSLLAGLLGALLSVGAWAQSSPRDFMPLSDLKAGMKGTGRTVFEGDKVEEFQVEI